MGANAFNLFNQSTDTNRLTHAVHTQYGFSSEPATSRGVKHDGVLAYRLGRGRPCVKVRRQRECWLQVIHSVDGQTLPRRYGGRRVIPKL